MDDLDAIFGSTSLNPTLPTATNSAAPAPAAGGASLLDFDDGWLDFGGDKAAPAPAPAPAAASTFDDFDIFASGSAPAPAVATAVDDNDDDDDDDTGNFRNLMIN